MLPMSWWQRHNILYHVRHHDQMLHFAVPPVSICSTTLSSMLGPSRSLCANYRAGLLALCCGTGLQLVHLQLVHIN